MDILVIARKNRFSPNHIGNDAAILNDVCELLEAKGALIEYCTEDEFLIKEVVGQGVIISMGRSKSLVLRLQKLEAGGKVVLNSAFGVENCFRKNMTQALLARDVPYPKSEVINTSASIDVVFEQLQNGGVWLKRGDFHAIHKEDVSFAASIEEAQGILEEYALREIEEAVVSEHLQGDLVKFYAVRGTDFFYWFYPYEHNHHKYAVYEQINGKLVYNSFDMSRLRETADKAAAVLNVEIYGGDAIISANGSFHIIDLNDWPSFAPCRAEGARAIAHRLEEVARLYSTIKDQSNL